MKVFSLGKLITLFVAVGTVSVSYKLMERKAPDPGHDIWIENLRDNPPERIEIHNTNALLPSASLESNGSIISVPLANMSAGRPSFPGYHRDGKVLYELDTIVVIANGVEKRIEYDMTTGAVLRILEISADGKKVEVFDRKGVLLETEEIK
ncbi:MAG TPA: hypothetical protein VKG78_06640 [Opitutaceae bacterium]|nr:hypothetical protein [Opitutaceae bacterium]